MTEHPMQLAMVGLGRMGANLARRLMRDGHDIVAYDVSADAVAALTADGAVGAASLTEAVASLAPPRAVWLMLPAALTGSVLEDLAAKLEPDDVVIDGGNSYYRDDIARAEALGARGLHYVDCGTSGGIWGLERGYSLMIGGEEDVVRRLDPIFRTIAPGATGEPTPARSGRQGTADLGYVRCGPPGAGHFVKMVHNGIEYGMMAAIAEGIGILRNANAGAASRRADAETSPLRDPDAYRYDLDVAEVAEVWRHGSVVSSWLVDLVADALARSPDLAEYGGRVSDSGEGRWTLQAAIDESVPAPVIAAALFERYATQGGGEFAAKVLSAMRAEFGGHAERTG